MTPTERDRERARAHVAKMLGFESGGLSDKTKLNGLTFGGIVTIAAAALADEREACAKVADAAYARWKANCDRPQSEHSGPSYAAAVAGEAASRDIAAAIRSGSRA